NICRSPMGEAVLRDVAKKRGVDLVVDSCGTSAYHIGEDPDQRTAFDLSKTKHKVPISCVGRQVRESDYTTFTHILAADESNLRQLLRVKPEDSTAHIRLWGSYLDNKPIPDPYYGGNDGFEQVYQQCIKLSNAFLDAVVEQGEQ
ncbi:hypothetical protein H0H93_008681, partial [Arthromyces matolae]